MIKWCPGAESNHRHEDFQSKSLRVYGQISWRKLTVLFLRCSLQRAARTYPEIEFPNSNAEFEKLIRKPEHTQCVSRIELHPNPEPGPNFESRKLLTLELLFEYHSAITVPEWNLGEPWNRPKNWQSENLGVSPGIRAREWPGVTRFGAAWELGCRPLNGPRGGWSEDLGWPRWGEPEPAQEAWVWQLQVFNFSDFLNSGHWILDV